MTDIAVDTGQGGVAVETPSAPAPAAAPVESQVPAAAPVESPSKPEPVRSAYSQAAASAVERAREVARQLEEKRTQARETKQPEQKASDPLVDVHGRKHDPASGEYLPETVETGEVVKADPASAETEDATATPAKDGGTEPAADADRLSEVPTPMAADTKQLDWVRIDLPDALKEQGRTYIEAKPDQVELLRALANGYVRRTLLDEIRKERDEERERRLHLESNLTAQDKIRQTPEYKAKVERYNKLKGLEEMGEIDEGTASEYWRTSQEDLRRLAQQEYQTRLGEVQAREVEQAAQAWMQDAWGRAQQLPAQIRGLSEFTELFQQAVKAFDAEINLGHFPQIKDEETAHEAFRKFFGTRLIAHPTVAEAYRQLQNREATRDSEAAKQAEAERQRKLREEAEKAGAEKLRRQMAETRQQTPPNPMAGVAHHASGVSPSHLGPDGKDDAALQKMSPFQQQRAYAERAAQRARERFRGIG